MGDMPFQDRPNGWLQAPSATADTDHSEATRSTRRDVLRLAGGGSVLAALATARLGGDSLAQEATSVPPGSKEGLYVVLRTRTVKADKSLDELTKALRDGLVPIIRAIPGFLEYYVVQNAETRERTGVSIFADKTGADESTKQTSDFMQSSGYGEYYEDVNPTIQEGTIVVFAGTAQG